MRGIMKGWPWGSGSHINTVVAILHWKGGLGLSPEKVDSSEFDKFSSWLYTHQNTCDFALTKHRMNSQWVCVNSWQLLCLYMKYVMRYNCTTDNVPYHSMVCSSIYFINYISIWVLLMLHNFSRDDRTIWLIRLYFWVFVTHQLAPFWHPLLPPPPFQICCTLP